MTFSQSDLPHIKWHLLGFLLVLGTGGAAVMLSENFVTQAQLSQQAAQRQVNEARGRLATAQDDRANMATYALEYSTLLQRKIIGNEQRLDWIEGLDKIQRHKRVLDFKYAIAPQQPYTPTPPLDSGNFELKLSNMTLQFDLLHEGQLINFFDTLRTDIKGWFILDHCALERSATAPETGTAPQLKAECTGGWLTLKNRNAK